MAMSESRRVGRAAAVALAATVVMFAGTSCASHSERHGAAYCAIMADSIGLYVGNPVTQMGYQIGSVTAITPDTRDVRVDFTVSEPRRLPNDVRAIIRSSSILADRSLELVGNYQAGPELPAGGCVPLGRSSTPKSLSEVVGSATDFINSINPQSSSNIGDVVQEVDAALRDNGTGINRLLTMSSALLDSPDEAISDIGSIITNLAQLTSVISEIRGPLKQIMLDAQQTTPDLVTVLDGSARISGGLPPLIRTLADLESELGEEFQFTLDQTAVTVRKASAHANRLADFLNPVPWWINSVANIVNNHRWNTLTYRPPLYRIRTPDGVATCNIMNASMPGSCANVQGQPYAVDVALLQYVLTQAAQR
jgi:phospholipid/cholesterol/gamma-HCH transport system substrate-binding protein